MSMGTVKIHNSSNKTKEDFYPLKGKTVKMYTCGVTVYDDCHIGHARSLYTFDVIVRYLKYKGFKVNFVRNITDVDDKIINRAKDLGVETKELADKYIKSYYKDLLSLGIGKADFEPRATENIREMVKYIEKLIKKDYAYVTDSGVYFDISKFKGYGKLSNQSIDQMLEGVRIQIDEKKKNPLDFALWKKSKEGEPSWKSPWGQGRPGWHIECSVMSQKYLKTDTLDIHGGGRDLIFPHHENELTQAEASTGKPFAKYWIHHGLLTINGQKMAKSLGNFVTINEVLSKYPADILKLFYLQAHYSSSIDFSWEKMEEVKRAYESIDILREKLKKEYGKVNIAKAIKAGTGFVSEFKEQFIQSMDDDFNTAQALAVLFEMVNKCNAVFDSNVESKQFILRYALDFMQEIAGIFGLTFLKDELSNKEKKVIEDKIKLRNKYRAQKKFKEADTVREELESEGIILEDTKEGTTFRRKI